MPRPSSLAVSIGEPAGIGPDLAIEIWHRRFETATPTFVLVGDPAFVDRRAKALGRPVTIAETDAAGAAARFESALPVMPVGRTMSGLPGRPGVEDAPAVIAAIDLAVEAVRRGEAAAVVTLPIQKATLAAAGFAHPGHTEYLGALAEGFGGGPWTPVMMLAGPELRTVPVTVHVALAAVPGLVTVERIVAVGRIVAADLAVRFGIARPRLAVAGLDPHAGEDGTIGTADDEIVRPAVAALVAAGIDARGPLPADTLFHPEARARYDAVLAMYHDQALIPVKTLDFARTVNVTLGLPFVRTSPDHGTALDLAATGRADRTSTLEAMRLADRLARHAPAVAA